MEERIRRLHMYLIGIPDGENREHVGKAIWRYNFWEFSRIKDNESSELKLQNINNTGKKL